MKFFKETIEELQEKGLYRSLRKNFSSQGPEIILDGRKVLNFCSNDYLGLASDIRLKRASQTALEKYGTGSGSARLISANLEPMDQLEQELALWKGAEAALLFNSGYHANIGVIPTLVGKGDVILSDELNHASIIDGCRLSKAETKIYRHNDLNHLENLLKGKGRRKLIVTEAIFSMEGDVCPVEDLLKLAQKYEALVYLDEAHAVGVLGEKGTGLAPISLSENLICMGTLGKAFGSYGAFVAGSKDLKAFLINKARSFIFTTALPPAVIGASLKALQIIQKEPERRKRLWENAARVGAGLRACPPGDHGESPLPSPIFSIPIGSADETMKISQRFLEEGIYIQGIRPPTVPEGTSRLRITITSAHTKDHLKVFGKVFQSVSNI